MFDACQRSVLVLEKTQETVDGAFDKQRGIPNESLRVLRFFRRRDACFVPKKQVCARLPDGRYFPYPWYRVGPIPILPGQEILFSYSPSEERGLHAVSAPDMGPMWPDTPTRQSEVQEQKRKRA